MLARLLRLVAASGIPGGGFLFGAWSPATALALYWVDNLVGSLIMAVRIAMHRRLTSLAGHGRAVLNTTVTSSSGGVERRVNFKSFLAEFLVTSLGFTVAHGVFLAVVLWGVLEPPDAASMREGALGIVFCHLLALTIDGFTLSRWPFARMKQMAVRAVNRVLVVQMTIIVGMAFLAWRQTPEAFFSVFVWLKTLTDIGAIVPQYNPREAPSWLVRVMSKIPNQKGESFEAYWRRTRAEEDAQAVRDEQPIDRP